MVAEHHQERHRRRLPHPPRARRHVAREPNALGARLLPSQPPGPRTQEPEIIDSRDVLGACLSRMPGKRARPVLSILWGRSQIPAWTDLGVRHRPRREAGFDHDWGWCGWRRWRVPASTLRARPSEQTGSAQQPSCELGWRVGGAPLLRNGFYPRESRVRPARRQCRVRRPWAPPPRCRWWRRRRWRGPRPPGG
jgi:hypothetical protein